MFILNFKDLFVDLKIIYPSYYSRYFLRRLILENKVTNYYTIHSLLIIVNHYYYTYYNIECY